MSFKSHCFFSSAIDGSELEYFFFKVFVSSELVSSLSVENLGGTFIANSKDELDEVSLEVCDCSFDLKIHAIDRYILMRIKKT